MTRQFHNYTRALALATVLALIPLGSAHGAEYSVEVLVPGYGFHGIHGIAFDDADRMYVGSVMGQSIYQVDTQTGESSIFLGPPRGMADDLEFGPGGVLVWTSFSLGIVHAKTGDGPIRELATGLPGINSIAFKQDGRLFSTQVFLGDALYEIDLAGQKPARKIIENMGGLNGFDFGPDGMLYGPLWFKGEVAKIDVDSGELTVVADGFETPAAVNFDSKGNLWVLDTKAGKIYRIDPEFKEKRVICELQTAMDNLAFDSKDRLFVTVMANNAIYEIDTDTGEAREVKAGKLSIPCDLDVVRVNGRDTLYLADIFALRAIDAKTGEVRDLARNYADELDSPIGISVNRGHILVSSWFSGTVQCFDRETEKSLIMAHDFDTPMDAIELDNGDWIVLSGAAGSLLRVSGAERETREVVAEGLAGPVAMTLAGDDAVYVSCSTGSIMRVGLSDGRVTEIASGLRAPEGLDVGRRGAIIVAEAGAKCISSIDPDTGTVTVIAKNLPIGLAAPAGYLPSYTPTGVAVSKSGTIYVSSDLEDAIYRIKRRR